MQPLQLNAYIHVMILIYPIFDPMKHLTKILGICLGLFTWACEEDFQLTEPYKPIPVVYGFLDRTDTAQYIRVEKAFVNEDIAASTIAQNPDSLYYANAEVILINKTQNKEYILSKVDGNLEGYPRSDGPFAKAPNYVYKIKTSKMAWNGGDVWELEVTADELANPVTATIVSVSDMKFTFPDDNTKQLKYFYINNYDFQWKHLTNTKVFHLKAIIHVEEVDIATNVSQFKTIELPITSSLPGKDGSGEVFTNLKIFSSGIYNALHDKLSPTTGVERYLLKIDYQLIGGGPELLEYFEVLNANTGVTASQEIPRYSNLSQGFGIFSSKHKTIKTINPQPPTVDSLRAHPLTKELNFK